MTKHRVCGIDELVPCEIVPKPLGRATILLTRLPSGQIKAIAPRCPHQGADLRHACITGCVTGDRVNELRLERVGEVLRCPWHGFEFDLASGKSVAEGKLRLRMFAVEVQGDDVYVVV
jgi:nitrite reductase/ring-hydroxylating ferredoxin subunit